MINNIGSDLSILSLIENIDTHSKRRANMFIKYRIESFKWLKQEIILNLTCNFAYYINLSNYKVIKSKRREGRHSTKT